MSFKRLSKGKEMFYMSDLLRIFGTIETKQLRMLFFFLTDAEYGKILAKLSRECKVSRRKGWRYISGNEQLAKTTNVEESVRLFWAFTEMRKVLTDYCEAGAPVKLSFMVDDQECDLLYLSRENRKAVEKQGEGIADQIKRFIVVADMQVTEETEFREENDYVMEVSMDGKTVIHEM